MAIYFCCDVIIFFFFFEFTIIRTNLCNWSPSLSDNTKLTKFQTLDSALGWLAEKPPRLQFQKGVFFCERLCELKINVQNPGTTYTAWEVNWRQVKLPTWSVIRWRLVCNTVQFQLFSIKKEKESNMCVFHLQCLFNPKII